MSGGLVEHTLKGSYRVHRRNGVRRPRVVLHSLRQEETMNEPVNIPPPPPSTDRKKLKLTKERIRKDVTITSGDWPIIIIF